MTIAGSCHCGTTKFECDAPPETVTRCTCSFCSKRGALWAYYTTEQFRLLGPEQDATYRWQTKTVAHHYCPTCGCGTFSLSPDWSTGKADFSKPKVGVNAHLFDDFDLQSVPVVVVDGKNQW
jgi:hypothetical protein